MIVRIPLTRALVHLNLRVRKGDIRSGSKHTSSIGSFEYLRLSSDSFVSSEKKRAFQQSCDEKQSRKEPKRKAKSNRKLFPDCYQYLS